MACVFCAVAAEQLLPLARSRIEARLVIEVKAQQLREALRNV
jgi:hypothetical protein